MKKRSFHSLDIFKLLMAFCVVAIHTNPLESCTIHIIHNIYDSFVRMAVPFFFLSSGFLLAQKFESPFSSAKNVAAVRKYLIKILKMYLVWTVVYLPMTIYDYISSGEGIVKSVLMFIKRFVLIGEQYNSWHLWYLLSTVYALVFLLILLNLKQSSRNILIIGSTVFVISIIIDCLSAYRGSLSMIALLAKTIRATISSGRLLTGLFYIPLGIMLSRSQPTLTVSWSMLVSGYLLNVLVDSSYLSTVFIAISTTGLFCVICSFTLPDSKVYPLARKMSTVIYFIHMYVWSFYYTLIYGEKTFGLDSFLMTMIICLILAALSVALTKQNDKKSTGSNSFLKSK